jgi:arylsulfatase
MNPASTTVLRGRLHPRRWLVTLLACVALGDGVAGHVAVAAPRQPNVLIVMTDDQGYGDFSCHGNPVLRTPHLDRLAEQSVRFADFHVAPMCTPTRGQLMTGRDAVRNGATSVTAGRSFIRPGIPTMPEIFAASGYRTGLFGKWHLGDNYPHRPMDKGFQEAVYHQGWGFTSAPEFANTLFAGRYFHNGVEQRFTGHCTDLWFQQAMRWMRTRKERSEPFFCYLPTNAPHGPCADADEFVNPYRGRGPAEFFGMIAHVDHCIGQLEQFLQETGLRDSTIVIFMTDNGGTAGVRTFNAGMRAGKTTYYDGGHRVPCWVRWPAGGLRAPGDVKVPTQNHDLLPTLIDLCGLRPPVRAEFDGVSLASLLRGAEDVLPDRMLIVQYGQQIEKWACCVIWNQWRLVKGTELYDIRADAGQTSNVAADQPAVLSKMRAHYERWWAGVEPQLNDFVPTSLGAEQQPLVSLTSSDWENIYCDNAGHIRKAAGGPRGGHWNVFVERAGQYEISLRRWPRETGLALGDPSGPDSVSFPIAAAVVEVAGQRLTARTAPTEKEVVLRAQLPRGRTTLHAWFQDDHGQDVCGAFYCYVRRLP